MSLGKMLAAGRSFFGGGASVSYRKNPRAALPQFNLGKNPFISKPTIMEPSVAVPKNVPPPKAVRSTRVTSWTEKLNPFRAPAPTRISGRAEQSELSLHTVKVLQNDLAETDIERVPAKSCTLPVEPASSIEHRWQSLANIS